MLGHPSGAFAPGALAAQELLRFGVSCGRESKTTARPWRASTPVDTPPNGLLEPEKLGVSFEMVMHGYWPSVPAEAEQPLCQCDSLLVRETAAYWYYLAQGLLS